MKNRLKYIHEALTNSVLALTNKIQALMMLINRTCEHTIIYSYKENNKFKRKEASACENVETQRLQKIHQCFPIIWLC